MTATLQATQNHKFDLGDIWIGPTGVQWKVAVLSMDGRAHLERQGRPPGTKGPNRLTRPISAPANWFRVRAGNRN